jgi:hypothetical protein
MQNAVYVGAMIYVVLYNNAARHPRAVLIEPQARSSDNPLLFHQVLGRRY